MRRNVSFSDATPTLGCGSQLLLAPRGSFNDGTSSRKGAFGRAGKTHGAHPPLPTSLRHAHAKKLDLVVPKRERRFCTLLATRLESDPTLSKPLLPRLTRPFTSPTTCTCHCSFDGRQRRWPSAGDVSRSTLLNKLTPSAASKSARLRLAGSRRLLRPAPKRGRVDDSMSPLHIHGSRLRKMTKGDTRRVCEA